MKETAVAEQGSETNATNILRLSTLFLKFVCAIIYTGTNYALRATTEVFRYIYDNLTYQPERNETFYFAKDDSSNIYTKTNVG
jgi:hypothetical protein